MAKNNAKIKILSPKKSDRQMLKSFLIGIGIILFALVVVITSRQVTTQKSVGRSKAGEVTTPVYMRAWVPTTTGLKVWAWQKYNNSWAWHKSNGQTGVDLSYLSYWRGGDGKKGPCSPEFYTGGKCTIDWMDFDKENGVNYLRLMQVVGNTALMWGYHQTSTGSWERDSVYSGTNGLDLSVLPYFTSSSPLGPCGKDSIYQTSCGVKGFDINMEGSNAYWRFWKPTTKGVLVWAYKWENGGWQWTGNPVDIKYLTNWVGSGNIKGPCHPDFNGGSSTNCTIDGIDFDTEGLIPYLRVWQKTQNGARVWAYMQSGSSWAWDPGNGNTGIDISYVYGWEGGHAPGVPEGPCYTAYSPRKTACDLGGLSFSQE